MIIREPQASETKQQIQGLTRVLEKGVVKNLVEEFQNQVFSNQQCKQEEKV